MEKRETKERENCKKSEDAAPVIKGEEKLLKKRKTKTKKETALTIFKRPLKVSIHFSNF